MPSTYIAFSGPHQIAYGLLAEVVVAAKQAFAQHPPQSVLVFDAASSEQIDLNLQGSIADLFAYLPATVQAEVYQGDTENLPQTAKLPGRPKLGVVAREVTLLPRHWQWLSSQPGGASVALRKLVEQELRIAGDRDRIRQLRDAAYRFMSVMAGNAAGFEEASRALFAGDQSKFHALIKDWPADIYAHVKYLADQFFKVSMNK